MQIRSCSVLSLMVSMLTLSSAAAAPLASAYELIDIGVHDGFARKPPAINTQGVVAFGADRQGVPPPPQTWSNGTYTTYVGASNPPTDINDHGDFTAGEVGALDHDIWINSGVFNIQTATGLSRPTAVAINNARKVLIDNRNNNTRSYIYDYNTGVLTDLGAFTQGQWTSNTTRPFAMNEHAQVVGLARQSTSRTRAFIWQNGELAELAPTYMPLHNTTASDINDLGIAVGSGEDLPLLFSNGAATVLQTPASHDGCYTSTINNEGFIGGYFRQRTGGYRALYWDTNNQVHNLSDLPIINQQGWVFETVTDANDAGWIVGSGVFNGENRTFLLRPIPGPQTVSFVVLFSGFAFSRRRR